MATAPSPNDLTRQQLDELDALLQRMLSVPLNGPEPPPTPPASATGWRTDTPSAIAAPPPHIAPPPLPTIPANPFVATIPAPETTQYLPMAEPEAVEPEPAAPSLVPPPEPAMPVVERRPTPPPEPPQPVIERRPAPPPPVVVPPPKPVPLPPVREVAPPAPIVVRAPMTPRQQPARPAPPPPRPEPAVAPPDPLGVYAESSAPPEPVPFLLWPLVGFNWLVDSILGLFGPPGRLLRSGFGKYVLGLTGIGLLLYTAAHLVTTAGWLALPFPIPWPR